MITKRIWVRHYLKGDKVKDVTQEGWYLLGLIPLYIRDMQVRGVVTTRLSS